MSFKCANTLQGILSKGFLSVWGVFMLAFVGLLITFIMARSPTASLSHIYVKTQLELYEKSMYELHLSCLRAFGIDECKDLSYQFDTYFIANSHAFLLSPRVILLDVFVETQNILTSHLQHISRRHILVKN